MNFSNYNQIIPHLFLLRELPIKSNSINLEYFIIRFVNQILHTLSGKELQTVQHAFAKWSELQTDDTLDAARLQEAIATLGPGEHLPIYVRSQNACLIISRLPANPSPSTSSTSASATVSSYEMSNFSTNKTEIESVDGIVFSTFTPALSSKQVAEAEGELLCNYPQLSIRVKRSPLLLSKVFAEQIERLHGCVCLIDEAIFIKYEYRGSNCLFEIDSAYYLKYLRSAQTR